MYFMRDRSRQVLYRTDTPPLNRSAELNPSPRAYSDHPDDGPCRIMPCSRVAGSHDEK